MVGGKVVAVLDMMLACGGGGQSVVAVARVMMLGNEG